METQDISKEILNDIEREKIAKFAEDTVMFEAVKKYIMAWSTTTGTFKAGLPFTGGNFALRDALGAIGAHVNPNMNIPRTDEELGANNRAMAFATFLVESGFKELKEMQKVKLLEEEDKNPAE